MAYYLSSRYKKYASGGWTPKQLSNMQGGLTLASGATDILGGLVKTDEYGRKSAGVDALSGAAKGAQMGMAAGPWGAAAGAVIGAGVSLTTNLIQKKKNEALTEERKRTETMMQRQQGAALIANNPELMYGNRNAEYFANGGRLSSNYIKATGGTLKPMSAESVEVEGPSHAAGGVQLPEMGAEVEGNETIHNGYVFSDRLGFAAEHKKIATSIGKIENKGAMTPERINALNRLEERQESLKLSQEYLKEMIS